jgi:hypothetical protein
MESAMLKQLFGRNSANDTKCLHTLARLSLSSANTTGLAGAEKQNWQGRNRLDAQLFYTIHRRQPWRERLSWEGTPGCHLLILNFTHLHSVIRSRASPARNDH